MSMTWSGIRTGWLLNYRNTTVQQEQDTMGVTDGRPLQLGSVQLSALELFFVGLDGDRFNCHVTFSPYFYVVPIPGFEGDVENGITSAFAGKLSKIDRVQVEDLDMSNHLSGARRTVLKLTFLHTSDMTRVRHALQLEITRNTRKQNANIHKEDNSAQLDCTFTVQEVMHNQTRTDSSESWVSHLLELREYDVRFETRAAIDLDLYVGMWYDINSNEGSVNLTKCDDSKYTPAEPRVCAFDIETTKAPLKFPQPEVDEVYMLSYMLDGQGYLIVNNAIVPGPIQSFTYSPRPEFKGMFQVFNEPDEVSLLRRWFTEMEQRKPDVFVTYNGDYFDFPFIEARATVHGLSLSDRLGFSNDSQNAIRDSSGFAPHIDCFYWVKRDSYLPQGSHGLKAVTKAKLGYDPVEVDPEKMLELAREKPEDMAAYSVSDALATYYLYMKYVNPFIFSLCTIIPMTPDDVLRKGSGTLCESLLCVQATKKNVLWPNKHVSSSESFHNGKLIDSETYIGGRVEALRSGVYRSDLPLEFEGKASAYNELRDTTEELIKFACEVENKMDWRDITNFEEVCSEIKSSLQHLADSPHRTEHPLIYHLDVGAMYPNIILTNRLQPSSMVSEQECATCCFNVPESQCKREMNWMWKGVLFKASRPDYERVKTQLETEYFSNSTVASASLQAQNKRGYGKFQRPTSVLVGTVFDSNKRVRSGSSFSRQSLNKETDGTSHEEAINFNSLPESVRLALIKGRFTRYNRRVFGSIRESQEELRTQTVCQRENSFYVDTVRLFRDRRYHFKNELRKWSIENRVASDPIAKKEAAARCVQMESLQLAHKCILNSFYGYVMRKGSRWFSMEMAGVVTYLGAGLIQMARAIVQDIGVTLELDTDGIWCCLPKSFPDKFMLKTRSGSTFTISFPCLLLNHRVHLEETNHQYQTLDEHGEYKIYSECSLYFEVDGPYHAMILPASLEEGKGIKKRYAVFDMDGSLAELKGFELKRRGELTLVKDFQSMVFPEFLKGSTLVESYTTAAHIAKDVFDFVLHAKGAGFTEEDILIRLSESSNLSRRLSDYPTTQKSMALTTARRLVAFLGPQMAKDKGLSCRFIVSKNPHGTPVTTRAIPTAIFSSENKVAYLREWTGNRTINEETELRELLDWDYYTQRFTNCVQKILTIPAALQNISSPLPFVDHPKWLKVRLAAAKSGMQQRTLDSFQGFVASNDLEDLCSTPMNKRQREKNTATNVLQARRQSNRITLQGTPPKIVQEMDESEDLVSFYTRMTSEEKTQKALRGFHNRFLRDTTRESTKVWSSDMFYKHNGFHPWLIRMVPQWREEASLRRKILLGPNNRMQQVHRAILRNVPNFHQHLRPSDLASNLLALTNSWDILQVQYINDRILIHAMVQNQLLILNCFPSSPVRLFTSVRGNTEATELLSMLVSHNFYRSNSYVVQDNALQLAMWKREDTTVCLDESKIDFLRNLFRCSTFNATAWLSTTPFHQDSSLPHFIIRIGIRCRVDLRKHFTKQFTSSQQIHEPLSFDVSELQFQKDSELYGASIGLDAISPNTVMDPSIDPGMKDCGQLLRSTAFVFYAQPSDTMQQAILFLLLPSRHVSNTAYLPVEPHVVLVQASSAARTRAMDFNKLFADVANEVFGNANHLFDLPQKPTIISYTETVLEAVKLIDDLISSYASATTPTSRLCLVVKHMVTAPLLSSPNSLSVLPQYIPNSLETFPVLDMVSALSVTSTVNIASNDVQRIFHNPLTWHRAAVRHAVNRALHLPSLVHERLVLSRSCRIPLCNLGDDPMMLAWSVQLARAKMTDEGMVNPLNKKQAQHMLRQGEMEVSLNNDEGMLQDELNHSSAPISFCGETWNPSAIAVSGALVPSSSSDTQQTSFAAPFASELSTTCRSATWVLRIDLEQLPIIAIIFSRTLTEGTSEHLSPQFRLLRLVVSALLKSARYQRDVAAAAMLSHLPRFLRSCHPKLLEHVQLLSNKALAGVIKSLSNLNGLVLSSSIMLETPPIPGYLGEDDHIGKNASATILVDTRKTSLRDAMMFASYSLKTLGSIKLMQYLRPHVQAYWMAVSVLKGSIARLELPNTTILQSSLSGSDNLNGISWKEQAMVVVPLLPNIFDSDLDPLKVTKEESMAENDINEKVQLFLEELRASTKATVAKGLWILSAASEAANVLVASIPLAKRGEAFHPAFRKCTSRKLKSEFEGDFLSEIDRLLMFGERLFENHPVPSRVGPSVRGSVSVFVKEVTARISAFTELENSARLLRNNGHRLCRIDAHDPNADWISPDLSDSFIPIECRACGASSSISLRSDDPLKGTCFNCGSSISPGQIESRLVKLIFSLEDQMDDAECSVCHLVTDSYLRVSCASGNGICTGCLITRQGNLTPLLFSKMKQISERLGFIWLSEVIDELSE